jgi:hypothetical protein
MPQRHLQQPCENSAFLTSAETNDIFVKGSFDTGKNKYAFNSSVVVKMEKRADGYYQVEYFKDSVKKERRMDIVVGSGTMGQSSLSWQDNHLFRCRSPISAQRINGLTVLAFRIV